MAFVRVTGASDTAPHTNVRVYAKWHMSPMPSDAQRTAFDHSTYSEAHAHGATGHAVWHHGRIVRRSEYRVVILFFQTALVLEAVVGFGLTQNARRPRAHDAV